MLQNCKSFYSTCTPSHVGTNEKDDGEFAPARVDSGREEKRRYQEEKMREKRDELMREAEGGGAVCCRIVNPFIQHVLQVV